MMKLHTRRLKPLSEAGKGILILRLTENPDRPPPLREKEILLVRNGIAQPLPTGFSGYIFLEGAATPDRGIPPNSFGCDKDFSYLCEGDILRFDPSRGGFHVLYRINSDFNSLLVTERCNSYCLMCSQPPKNVDDGFILGELLEAVPMMSRSTKEIGITGGEPTLLGDGFFALVKSIKLNLPETSIHILSNGRRFKDQRLAMKLAHLDHHDLMVGIPLYSELSNLHDYVVQADGAYDETLSGILNLKRYGQKVELRVVIHKVTCERLPFLAEFIVRNLHFVDHVALMGLEMMGFTKANLKTLWVDPVEYQSQLLDATLILDRAGMNVSIFNHQLCLLDPLLRPFNRKSISDWKNEFMPECEECVQKSECGGFFSSATLRYSDHIKPFTLAENVDRNSAAV